jgi:hypothetical protein
MPLFTVVFGIRQPAQTRSREPLDAVYIGKSDRVFPENHARLTEIQSAFIEHPQKQPSQLDFRDLAQEFIYVRIPAFEVRSFSKPIPA